ncbi:peptidyl-prolyl cis-trans isomerase [Pseudoalteromonas piscicida]|uniref:peptidylprolyl isomerase n=1 Tax=Pseudoalteromonas piscicida TaxID=43662 RepID=UPI001C9734F1|nr:peptidylprolyl isomerase [Pseudoalteromonas piscicida]QZO13825.1 peptidyl-prolyl cis-trans isomerase [Pseudoalteromonas piscicida]
MRFVLLFLVSSFCLPSFASPSIPKALTPLVHQLYLEQGRTLSKKQTTAQLLENQFLLFQAKQLNPSILERQSNVGFSTRYHVDKFLASSLLHWFPALSQLEKKHYPLVFDKEQMLSLLGQYPADGRYPAEQLLKWQQLQLTKSAPLTLAQVLHSQSMQNRFKLHQGELALLQAIVNQHLNQQALFTAAKPYVAKQGLTIEQLRQVVTAELLRPSMLAFLGVKEEMHGATSQYVDTLRNEIPESAIAKYYERHKKRFKYIKQVSASAAKFPEQKAAQQFNDYANAHSWQQAVAKYTPILIWQAQLTPLTRQSMPKWETQLAFSNQQGKITPSIRTPSGEWLVLYSQSPVYDYYDVKSETVRYQALRALTQEFAQHKFEQDYMAWKAANSGAVI